jgi:hypothetical protein
MINISFVIFFHDGFKNENVIFFSFKNYHVIKIQHYNHVCHILRLILVMLIVLIKIEKSTWAPTFTTCATYCLI